MVERILTLRELNRATLARQMLLDRSSLPALEAIKRLVGLQAQVSNAPYIGLWTRLHSFTQDDLTHLIEQWQVVRATMMRSTLHLMTAEDYLLMRSALQPALTRALHAFFGQRAKELDIDQITTVARKFVEEQPRTSTAMRKHLVAHFPDKEPEALAYVVRTHLPLVQVPPGGVWGVAGSPVHALAESWLGRPLTASHEGLRILLLRYLAAFGPATVKDIQTWSGLLRLQSVIDELKPELRLFQDEQGNELLDLPDIPLYPEDTPAPPRFLPEFDNLLLSHADRKRVVPDDYRSSIFLTVGRVRASFLVDGFVAGTWRTEREKKLASLVIEPFHSLSTETRDALVAEGERLIRFIHRSAESYEVQFA
jgi:hypothetical protein